MAYAYDPNASDPGVKILQKFDEAWRADRRLIRKIARQERREIKDRIFAAEVAGITLEDIPEDLKCMAMLPGDYNTDDSSDGTEDSDDDDIDNEEGKINTERTSIVQTTTSIRNKSKRKKCVICVKKVRRNDPDTPCGHSYCLKCLRELFNVSMKDESLMPPSCCKQNIPITLANLTPKETEDFHAKRVEFSTKDRLYCSQPTCSTFIPPTSIINTVGTCPNPNCRKTTCSLCKAASHGSLDCPKDEATTAVLAVAREAGWSRCYSCGAVVELTHGCYHMTCRCRAQFCYMCSKPWKNCLCAQWDEQRLLEEAQLRTARIPTNELPPTDTAINASQRVQNMANQLRANYECDHTDGWIYTPGGGTCDACDDYLRSYLYRCSGCHFMACRRCRYNRL